MKYFLFNHVGSYNHGCEAIIRGTMNIISHSDPHAEFVLSSFHPETDEIIEGVEKRPFSVRELTKMETLVSAYNVKVKHSEEYALKQMYSDIVKEAEDCDICLSVGGDTYCYGDNSGIQVLTRELKASGKKVVLWGASIGEEDLDDSKAESLRDFDAIFARESLTAELLKKRNLNDNVFLFPDPAFCMEWDAVEPQEGFTKENTLGFNVSPLVARSNPRIGEFTENFIDFVFENTTLNILFVPHVIEEGNNDYEYMLSILNKFRSTGRVAILPPDLNAKQYKGYISKTRFFIGARTHATIGAYSSGVPTAVLGYSVKSRGIAKDIFGDEKYVLDVKNIKSEEDIIDILKELIINEAEIKNTLRNRVPVILRDAMQAGEKLKNI